VLGFSSPKTGLGKPFAGLPQLSEDTLLALPELEAVTIETRVEDSCAAAQRAIDARKHVHLDKPGALSHADFKRMRQAAETRGLTVQMGYMLRANPAFQWLFQAVREGWLGDLLEIDAMMGKLANPATRQSLASLEGGGMFELACHLVDAVLTLLGKPTEVVAGSTPSQPDHVQDNQIALLLYPKTSVTLRCNHADPFGGPRRRFTVSGTRGCVEILPLESGEFTLSLTEPRGTWKAGTHRVKLPLPRARYDEEFVELARVIRGEKNYAWNAAHDIAVHETVLRAAGLPV
jgi:predicted dehydrogenase